MKPPALTAAALALALVACGSPSDEGTEVDAGEATVTTSGQGEEAEVVVEGADGATVTMGAGAAAVAGPAWARPYPGARVMTSVDAGSGDGATTFETDADPDTVIAYYRERAGQAGLADGASMTMGGMRQYAAEADGQRLTVVVQPQGARSVVQLAWETAG